MTSLCNLKSNSKKIISAHKGEMSCNIRHCALEQFLSQMLHKQLYVLQNVYWIKYIYIDIFMWFKQSLFHMFTVMTAWCLSYVQSYGGKKLNVLFMDCTVLLKNKNCKYFTLNGYLSISNFLLYIHIFF